MLGRIDDEDKLLVLKEGDKVHYSPAFGKPHNGIVKSVSYRYAFVVYHCDGNWEMYKDYTASRVEVKDLR